MMNLHISIALLVVLLTGGNSLTCYHCLDQQGRCERQEDCSYDSMCAIIRKVEYKDGTMTETNETRCVTGDYCESWSQSSALERKAVSVKCCDTDLCNDQEIPAVLNIPNGKKCYSCDWQDCSNTVNCWGNEDYCFTTNEGVLTEEEGDDYYFSFQSETNKGCASKSFCEGFEKVSDYDYRNIHNVTCCEGDLCNSVKSINQNVLIFFWLFFFYIMFL
nr:urokinase plasminogen activator surface receptor-like [Misgurnus anguillicaudatus]